MENVTTKTLFGRYYRKRYCKVWSSGFSNWEKYFTSLGKNCRGKNYKVTAGVLMRDGRGAVRLSHTWGVRVREFPPPAGGPEGLPPEKF